MTEVREIKIKKLEADRKNYPQWRAAAIDLLCARDVDWVLDGAHEEDPQAPNRVKSAQQDKQSPKQRYKHSQEPEADGAGSSDEAEHEHEQDKLTAAWLKRLSVSATKLTKNYKKDDAVARNILRQSVHQRLENAMVHMQTAKEMWRYLEPTVQMSPSDYMHRVQEEVAVHLYSDPMQMCDAMQVLLTVARMNPSVGELRWAEQLLMGAAMASCPVDRYWGDPAGEANCGALRTTVPILSHARETAQQAFQQSEQEWRSIQCWRACAAPLRQLWQGRPRHRLLLGDQQAAWQGRSERQQA